MKKFCYIVLALLFGALSARGQGQYLDGGLSGSVVQAEYTSLSNTTGLTALVGYSINGRVDIQASFGETWISSQAVNATIPQFTVGVNVYPLKQNHGASPVTVGLSAGYETAHYMWSGPSYIGFTQDESGLPTAGETRNQYGFDFGTSVFRNFEFSSDTYIQPFVGVDYSTVNANVTAANGGSMSESDSRTIVAVGFSLVDKTSESEAFVARPEADFYSANTVIGLGVMVIF